MCRLLDPANPSARDQHKDPRGVSDRQPVFNVPTAVVAVIGLLVAIHLARQLLAPETEVWLVLAMAFIPARYAGYAAELPGGEAAAATSLVTHMLAHGDATHLLFNSAWLLAFGGAVARRVGSTRFLALWLRCGGAGARAVLAAHPGALVPVMRACGAAAGVMGAAMRFFFSALDTGLWRLRLDPRSVAGTTLGEALRDRRILLTTAAWLAINLLAIVGFAGVATDAGIAWEAHLGGYLAGLLTFGLFDSVPRPRAPEGPGAR